VACVLLATLSARHGSEQGPHFDAVMALGDAPHYGMPAPGQRSKPLSTSNARLCWMASGWMAFISRSKSVPELP